MKQTQKLRLIVSGVSFYTTVKQVQRGVGDLYSVNAAAQKCLLVLQDMRDNNSIPPIGLAGHWEGLNVQIDMIK